MKALALAFALVALGTAPRAPREGPVIARLSATPDTAAIGKAVRVVYEVSTPLGTRVQFPVRPANDSTWTWNDWKIEKDKDTPQGVLHRVSAVALPFKTGSLTVPGLGFRYQKAGDAVPENGTFPALTLPVVSVMPKSPEPPDIKGLKPVFQPPWWTTFPWWIVAAALLLIVLIVWLVRRRKKGVTAAPERKAAPVPAIAAHVEALAALDALAKDRLPEKGLMVEHQTRLAALVRRFLERRFGSPQPGYTTRELVGHLLASGLTSADVERLRGLLRVSDLTKFARSEPPIEAAKRAEGEARDLILAWADRSAETTSASGAHPAPSLPKAG